MVDTRTIGSALLESNIVYIPYWLKQAFSRNKLDNIDVFNYSKIRKMLSVEDIAQLLYSNSFDKSHELKDLASNFALLSKWKDSSTEEERAELYAVILPLSHSDATKNSVHDRFSVKSDNTSNADDKEYSFSFIVGQERTAFIILKETFFCDLRDRSYKKLFVSEFLKVLYSFYPVHIVSSTPAFRLYLDLI